MADESTLVSPSILQTPTPIVDMLKPPQLNLQPPVVSPPATRPILATSQMQPASAPQIINGRRVTGWRMIPIQPDSTQIPVNTNGNMLVGQPMAGQRPFTQQPMPMASLLAQQPERLPPPNPADGIQTNVPSKVKPLSTPKARTTTWGDISNQPPTGVPSPQGYGGISYGADKPTGAMQENHLGSGQTTHGFAADENGDLQPIAEDSSQTAGGAGSSAGNLMEPNINPPWMKRLFPNRDPFWMESAIWKRFDGNRQKISAAVYNVSAERRSKKECKLGCQCRYCKRERRKENRDFGGWLSWGTTINSHGNSTSTGNDPLGFNNFADGFLLNQTWLYGERRANTSDRFFDWGYRADFMFGADGPNTTAFGDESWDFSWATGGEYGFALPQLYGTVAFGDLFVNFGRFYTIIGYESVMALDNFFYSHTLTFAYNEPFTHTGALAQYNWNDYLTLFAGYTTGWDNGFRNPNEGGTFLGGVRFDLTDDLNLFYATSAGDPGDTALGESDVYMHSLVMNAQVTQNINYILQWDYQDRTTFGTEKNNSYSIVQYLLTRLSDRLSVGTRFEWFRDDDGPRIGNGPGNYFDLTLGINYCGRKNFTLRPEIRYDWFDGAGNPYDDNTEQDQFTFGLGGY